VIKYYERKLNINELLKHKSLFLLGPRQTGKSTLLQHQFPGAKSFNLLRADTFRDLSSRPELLRQSLKPEDRLVILDEIQKLPSLLDEVQFLIDQDPRRRFILTGSSARKLKRSDANLLAGRAWICHLHPLVSAELDFQRLTDRLNRGSLPAVIDSPLPLEDLKAYVGTYLQEEVRAEGLTRSIENFSRFLDTAGLTNGELVNFTKVANDAGLPPKTVREYYQILTDTLIGLMIPPFQKTAKRKPVSTAKFYFFDVGVANYLMRRGQILPGSADFGRALEHLVALEVRAYLDYSRIDLPLTFWRSQSKFEVDLVVGDHLAIEVKAKERITDGDLKGLRALADEMPLGERIVVSLETWNRQTEDGIQILGVEEFFRRLWNGAMIPATPPISLPDGTALASIAEDRGE